MLQRSKKALALLLAVVLVLGLLPMATAVATDPYGPDTAAEVAPHSVPATEPGAPWAPNTAPTIVRGLLLDLWGWTARNGSQGLLRHFNITGIAVPTGLLELVDEEVPGWSAWFMTHSHWERESLVSQLSATATIAADNLAWNDPNRITNIDQFFSYFEPILHRAIYLLETMPLSETGFPTGLFYLMHLEPGATNVVIGFAIPPTQTWDQIIAGNFPTFNRLVEYVLSPPESPVLWGDVNGDGEVDWADLFLLLDHLNDPSVVVAPGADVNGDGDVDWADLFLLLDHLNDPSVVLGPQ